MPPAIQSGNANDRDRKLRPGEKRSDLVCRVKYCNTLPDIPFDPKFITYPFLPNRFVEYKPTSLERNYKHDLLTEQDLGVTIDLINPDTYAIDPEATLHPDDERLLEDDALTPQDSKRSRHHNKAVPWMKKTEYISNEFNRYGNSSEKTETKVGYNVKRSMKEDDMGGIYMDRESRINAINKTFEDAKIPIEKHYSKPNIFAVEEYPVFPDHKLWRYPFAQVMFDSEPAPNNEIEKMSQAMIRGVMDESGEQFVAYFMPTEETVRKRKRDAENEVEYEDDEEYEYKMAREYNWNVKNKASKGYEENYFFVFRDGCVYYNELETRVRLSKRRMKPGVQPSNSKLLIKHRPLNEIEFKTQEVRMMQLEPPEDEEEEETQENEEGKENEEENEAEVEEKENGEGEASGEEKGSASSSESEDENKKEESEKEESEKEDSDKEQESGDEAEKEKEDDKASVKSSSSSKSSKSSKSSAKSSSSSSSSSSSESEAEETEQNKRDEEEIFGSDSD